MRIRSLTVPITVAAILVLVPAPSAGSTIVFDFTGQVSKIYDSYGLIGSLAQVGDPLTARLAYELPTSVLDSDPSPALGLYLGVPGSLGFTVNGMTFETTEVLQVSVSLAGLGAMQFTGPRSWPAELPMTDRLHVSLGLSQTGSPSSLFSSDELPWSIDFSKVDSRTGAIIGGAGEQWYGMEVTLDPTVTTSIIIPEPGSASLLAIGLLPFVLGFLGRRRRFRRHC